MRALTISVVIAAFLGSATNHGLNHNRWPGCDKAVHGRHRDWNAWYKQLNRSGIRVHVYRDPPFNWLHPVSYKCLNQSL